VSTRIGLMGFGRIGRNVFRILHDGGHDVEVVAIVDVVEPQSLEYLLRFDTVHGRFEEPVEVRGDSLVVRGRSIKMINAKAPGDVDWTALGVEVVVEATGQYRTKQILDRHLARGAKRVVLTVPPRDPEIPIVIRGVNDAIVTKDTTIVSAASCTANALAPICKILDDTFGIDRAFMTTVHAYTNDQRLADVPHAEMRRSRAAAENIIPTETYAPRVVMGILPQLAGKLDGMAQNVPVPDGSNVDLVALVHRTVTAEEVNAAVQAAARGPFRGVLEYTEQPIVSSDVIGNDHSAVFDALSTSVLGGNLVKTITWYDNGWGYAGRVVELIERMAEA
jgi:glyceraldehyde 3-phosphate dehydrogenase (phosphorylating)